MFSNKILGEDYDAEKVLKQRKTPAKRKREGGGEKPVKKKARKFIDWDSITEEELKKLTANELKGYSYFMTEERFLP